jgi:hypothetical protein
MPLPYTGLVQFIISVSVKYRLNECCKFILAIMYSNKKERYGDLLPVSSSLLAPVFVHIFGLMKNIPIQISSCLSLLLSIFKGLNIPYKHMLLFHINFKTAILLAFL